MPDKQVNNKPERNPDGTIKKGYSLNPNGRPKKENTWSNVANQMLDANEVTMTIKTPDGKTKTLGLSCDKSFREAIIFIQIGEAMKGNIQAQKELADRTEGKPNQMIEQVTKELPEGFVTKRI